MAAPAEQDKSVNPSTPVVPKDWDVSAQKQWLAGHRTEAIQALIHQLNSRTGDKTTAVVLQLGYYFFLLNDYPSAATVLRNHIPKSPENLELKINIAVCESRLGHYPEAIYYANTVAAAAPDYYLAYDILAKCYYRLSQLPEAAKAGSRALSLKNAATQSPTDWHLPNGTPQQFAAQKYKKQVISFSLWGDNPRYLRGALRNLLLAPEFYPDWDLWFYLDDTVPTDFVALIEELGGHVIPQQHSNSLFVKLIWRFKVANAPDVGYFLVRDTDSVFSLREVRTVEAWLQSDKWFHVIRDWWTHTDLMLAGLWGGIAGVLPAIDDLLTQFPAQLLETPNHDQWFLRDCVWAYVRQSCWVHDRCFNTPDSVQLTEKISANGHHIGENEFLTRPDVQAKFLKPWLEKYPCLKV